AWWAILLGNVLAAGGMLAYFFVGHRALGRALLGPRTRVAQEGFVAGALGAAAVAVWFLLYDTAAGAPLRTPALLGAAVLEGLRDPAAPGARSSRRHDRQEPLPDAEAAGGGELPCTGTDARSQVPPSSVRLSARRDPLRGRGVRHVASGAASHPVRPAVALAADRRR